MTMEKINKQICRAKANQNSAFSLVIHHLAHLLCDPNLESYTRLFDDSRIVSIATVIKPYELSVSFFFIS